jgi:uncharacterized protein YcbK (DUF882 family)
MLAGGYSATGWGASRNGPTLSARPANWCYGRLVTVGIKIATCLFAAIAAVTLVTDPAFPEARVPHGAGLGTKKGPTVDEGADTPVLATLVDVHTGEHIVLDSLRPEMPRFDAFLSDRVTGATHPIEPALLQLLRALAARHPASRIEIVSGYRSPKLNEMLRKKGHHVASHSQHTLGHACDFRVVAPGDERGLDPRLMEQEIRGLGWTGGIGVYPEKDDWFIHADVGPTRRWLN